MDERRNSEFAEKIIQINRVAKKTTGGNRISFSVLVVIGNRKGRVGVGLGKAHEVPAAIAKAINRAKKTMIDVPLKGTTLPKMISLKLGAAQILLKPAPPGTGLRAGGPVRAVVSLAGVTDLSSKIMGTRNKVSNVYATFEALRRLK